jgi:hypothetical protein
VPGTRFIVSEPWRQLPEGVTITDAQGTSQFDVAGSSTWETLSLRVPGGRELAVVRRHVPTGGFEVVAGDQQLALVRSRSFGRYWISISGEDVAARGSIEGGSYVLSSHAGDDLAGCRRLPLYVTEDLLDLLRLPRDLLRRPEPRIVIDIKPGNEPAIMLAAVLAIEWLCEERRRW